MATSLWRSTRGLAIVGAISLGVIPIGGATIAADTPAGRSTSVPTYRGDAARTGVMPGPAPDGVPSILWQFQAAHRLLGSPTLAGGILHAVSGDGLVHGLALEGGDERWTADLGAQGSGTPLIAQDVLVVADEAGILHGLAPSDGSPRWTLALDGAVTGAPAYDDERGLLVAVTNMGTAYGVDPATGTETWQAGVGGPAVRSVTIGDGTGYFGVTPGMIVALDTADGTVRWRRPLATEGDVMTPTVAEGRLYVGLGGASTGHLWALDPATGDALWEYDVPPSVAVWTPAVSGGRAYVVRTDGVVEALDAASGAVAWSVQTASPVHALPALVDDVLLVAGTGGPVVALDTATGESMWSVAIAGRPWAPIAADGYVLVQTDAGILYAIGGEDAS